MLAFQTRHKIRRTDATPDIPGGDGDPLEKTHPRFNREWVECFITVVGVLFNHLRCPVGEAPSVFQMRVARPRPAVEICRALSLGILPHVGNARTNPAGGCDSGPVGVDLEPKGPLPHSKCEWAASISSCRNLLIFRFRDFKSVMIEANWMAASAWRSPPAVVDPARSRNLLVFWFQHFKCDSVVSSDQELCAHFKSAHTDSPQFECRSSLNSTHRDFKYEWVEHCLLPGSSAGDSVPDSASGPNGGISNPTPCTAPPTTSSTN